ncbi:hypothetical protein EVAR_322_1 [Eumeta japonica]|uniref:Uncharacterized protein n=1 Tax=Eumeta variegata TaxID=151549 RepID=A0A4C1S9U0_EUMVA|nr:hypothetical protein EVAR_322_1 [Eumeta japonica]
MASFDPIRPHLLYPQLGNMSGEFEPIKRIPTPASPFVQMFRRVSYLVRKRARCMSAVRPAARGARFQRLPAVWDAAASPCHCLRASESTLAVGIEHATAFATATGTAPTGADGQRYMPSL